MSFAFSTDILPSLTTPNLLSRALMLTRIANQVIVVQAALRAACTSYLEIRSEGDQ